MEKGGRGRRKGGERREGEKTEKKRKGRRDR